MDELVACGIANITHETNDFTFGIVKKPFLGFKGTMIGKDDCGMRLITRLLIEEGTTIKQDIDPDYREDGFIVSETAKVIETYNWIDKTKTYDYGYSWYKNCEFKYMSGKIVICEGDFKQTRAGIYLFYDEHRVVNYCESISFHSFNESM